MVFLFLHRTVCSRKTSLTQLFMYTGLVLFVCVGAQIAANAGTLLLTVQNVQLPYPLKASCTWPVNMKILIVSAILRATVTTSTRERCAWDSGSVNAMGGVMETMMPTLDMLLCCESSLRKFQKHKLRHPSRTATPEY